jgi:hypothetical protein
MILTWLNYITSVEGAKRKKKNPPACAGGNFCFFNSVVAKLFLGYGIRQIEQCFVVFFVGSFRLHPYDCAGYYGGFSLDRHFFISSDFMSHHVWPGQQKGNGLVVSPRCNGPAGELSSFSVAHNCRHRTIEDGSVASKYVEIDAWKVEDFMADEFRRQILTERQYIFRFRKIYHRR